MRRVLRSRKQKPLPSERDVILDCASVTVGGGMDSDVNSSSCYEPISKKRKLRKKDPESDADSNFGYDSEDVNASDTAIEGNRSEFQKNVSSKEVIDELLNETLKRNESNKARVLRCMKELCENNDVSLRQNIKTKKGSLTVSSYRCGRIKKFLTTRDAFLNEPKNSDKYKRLKTTWANEHKCHVVHVTSENYSFFHNGSVG